LTTKKPFVPIENLPPVLTLKRAAEVAGVSRLTVRRWVREGALLANRHAQGGAQVMIDTRSLLQRIAPWLVQE
jgi:excisionase family DNA binding protein